MAARAKVTEKAIREAWAVAEAAFVALARHQPLGTEVEVAAWRGGRGEAEPWAARGDSLPPKAGGALAAAGSSMVALASLLPLGHGPDLREVAVGKLGQAGRLQVFIENAVGDRADGDFLHSPERAYWLHLARTHRGAPKTDWDAACRVRMVRPNVFGGNDLVEPGAAWFVQWLESVGCRSLFSCEGHPAGFYVDFEGPYEVAHALAGLSRVEVSIFRSGLLNGPNLWRMTLNGRPKTKADRDEVLRELARRMASLRTALAGHAQAADGKASLEA